LSPISSETRFNQDNLFNMIFESGECRWIASKMPQRVAISPADWYIFSERYMKEKIVKIIFFIFYPQ
jgi:hypothetical protein